jgi:3-demethoxyubiquinol 3-hydroxylase
MKYKHLFTPKKKLINQIIMVDHAGELGAKYIYLGQLEALPKDKEIINMLDGELKHLEFFENQIKNNGYTPSLINPIWKKFAFLMGFFSAKHSRDMAMLCTHKVEDVIQKHYQSQIDILEEGELKNKLIQFRNEEIEHMEIGIKEEDLKNYKKLYSAIFNFITRFGIFFSSKI